MPVSPASFFPARLEPKSARRLAFLFLLDTLLAFFQEVSRLKTDVGRFTLLHFPEKKGIVQHLQFYATKLCEAACLQNETPKLIAEEIFVLFTQFYADFLCVKQPIEAKIPLEGFAKQAEDQAKALFSSLFPFFQKARRDENMLLYLLEHRGNFNEFLGEKAIEQLFFALFPKGLRDLRSTLLEGFSRRGFADFFRDKEHLVFSLTEDRNL